MKNHCKKIFVLLGLCASLSTVHTMAACTQEKGRSAPEEHNKMMQEPFDLPSFDGPTRPDFKNTECELSDDLTLLLGEETQTPPSDNATPDGDRPQTLPIYPHGDKDGKKPHKRPNNENKETLDQTSAPTPDAPSFEQRPNEDKPDLPLKPQPRKGRHPHPKPCPNNPDKPEEGQSTSPVNPKEEENKK